MNARTNKRTTRRAAFISATALALGLGLFAGPATAAQWDTTPSDETSISTGHGATALPGGDLRVDLLFGNASSWPADGLFATVIYTPASGAPVTLADGFAVQPDRGVTLTAPVGLLTADQSGSAAPIGTVTTTVTNAAGEPLSSFGGTWHVADDPSSAWVRTENVTPSCLPSVPVFAHASGQGGGAVRMSGAPDASSCEDGPSEMQTIYGPGDVTVEPTSPLMARFIGGETVTAVVTSESGEVVGQGKWVWDGVTHTRTSTTPAVLSDLSAGVYTVTWTGTSSYRDGAGFEPLTVTQTFRYETAAAPEPEPTPPVVTPEPPVTEPGETEPAAPAPSVAPEPAPDGTPAAPAPVPVDQPVDSAPAPAPAPAIVIETGLPEESGSAAGWLAGGLAAAGAALLAVRRYRLREGQ